MYRSQKEIYFEVIDFEKSIYIFINNDIISLGQKCPTIKLKKD